MNLAATLATLTAFLEKGHFKFGLAGALALRAYGSTRFTADIDLIVERRAQHALLAWLDAEGYERLHVSTGYSNHLHRDPARGRLDFIYVDAPTANTVLGSTRSIELFPGQSVPVPRPEHLAAMKILAMSNDPSRTYKELADLQFILGLPGIDEDLIREQFERYGLRERFNELKKLSSRP